MNQQAVAEHAKKMWSLPGELKEAVNACVAAHFPEHVDKAADTKTEQEGQYGQVYRGWCPFSFLSLALLSTLVKMYRWNILETHSHEWMNVDDVKETTICQAMLLQKCVSF